MCVYNSLRACIASWREEADELIHAKAEEVLQRLDCYGGGKGDVDQEEAWQVKDIPPYLSEGGSDLIATNVFESEREIVTAARQLCCFDLLFAVPDAKWKRCVQDNSRNRKASSQDSAGQRFWGDNERAGVCGTSHLESPVVCCCILLCLTACGI